MAASVASLRRPTAWFALALEDAAGLCLLQDRSLTMYRRLMCAVNRHHYSTEAKCIDKLGGTQTEDRALRRRNSSADFGAGMRRKSNRFPPAYILAQSEKSRGYGGRVPI